MKFLERLLWLIRGPKSCPTPELLAFRHSQEIAQAYSRLFLTPSLEFTTVECECGRYHVQRIEEIENDPDDH